MHEEALVFSLNDEHLSGRIVVEQSANVVHAFIKLILECDGHEHRV